MSEECLGSTHDVTFPMAKSTTLPPSTKIKIN